MSSRNSFFGRNLLAASALCLVLAGAMGSRLQAEETQEADPNVPLLVINVASVDRLLDQVVTTFDAANRPELSETLSGALERVNDLKGLNRTQSTGIMMFLSGLVPDSVAYVPIKNVAELVKTIEATTFGQDTRLLAKQTGEN